MNLDRAEGVALVKDVLEGVNPENMIEVVFAPSFVHLYKAAKMCANTSMVSVAAQDCSANKEGAFTGEVSASMIASCNAEYVILGHSERRANFRETNTDLKTKIGQVFSNNLKVVFCCGESLEQRNTEVHFDWIKTQISESLFYLSSQDFDNVTIAYEPIWAIGTGVTASTEQAQEMHAFIRNLLMDKYGAEVAENTTILYGGSCKPSNAKELFAQEDIDGGLIGGASLKAADFIAITQSF